MPAPATQTQTTPINFQKVFSERVYIKKDGPTEPDVQATGGELLHGYLSEIYRLGQQDERLRATIEAMCHKWNIYYVE